MCREAYRSRAADELVDVAVGRPEVVPGRGVVVLRVADELDAGRDHSRPRGREVVDEQRDDRPRPEEVVVSVTRAVNVDLSAVGEAKAGVVRGVAQSL